MTGSPPVLFSEEQIAGRVAALADEIAAFEAPPEIVAPVLIGAFVFAADLLRALARAGLDLPLEFLWLRSYGDARKGGTMAVRAGPGEAVRDRHVLLIDGVLDRGDTLCKARDLLLAAGARAITTAVVVDKRLEDAALVADHACFTHVRDFITGYGMDDAGLSRGLPYIGKV